MNSHSIITPRGRRYNMGYAPVSHAKLARTMPVRSNRIGLGDVSSDNADLTMQNQAQTLQANPPSACVQDGITQNFQAAWNASTPGQSNPITVDGKYGPQTAGALANALNYSWTDTNGNQHAAIGGNAPASVCGAAGGGGGVTPPKPSPSPTPVNPSQTTTVTTSSMNPWIIGGALVAAAGIAGWAYYAKGGGKRHLRSVHRRMTHR